MSNSHGSEEDTAATPESRSDMKFEFIVIGVSDIDRAKDFYSAIGWTLDMDFVRDEGFRVIQFTPPGSYCSIIFGQGITTNSPGSAKGLYLVVSDIETARAGLLAAGAKVSEIFHDAGGVFHHAGGNDRVQGTAPQRRSYGSFAEFGDPDGNGWLLQEVTVRLPGHGLPDGTRFSSPVELSGALRRAHAAYEAQRNGMGLQHPDWTTWYADYIVLEQAGKALPT
jgi:catechol 2,3-dioxygenase-like lactoylglutathione lyase family enzyme